MSSSQVVPVRSPKAMASVLMFAAFIGLFSETALNMALTNIMSDFSVSPATAQWLTTGYLLTIGILVPVSSLLIQWFTTKQLVVGSLTFSIVGTILAAVAPSFTVLLIGRIVQALGTGIILPLMMNVILLIFPIYKRGAVMGLMGLVITTAPAVGPVLAGLIVDSLDWAYIFWISLIFYVALIIIGLKQIDNVSKITKPAIDLLSILLSTLGFGGLMYSLSNIAEKSFYSVSVYAPFIVGAVSIILFSIRQMKMKQPMINLRVFKFPMFTLGALLLFSGMLLILSSAILLPMYLKGSLLFSATVAGMILLPGSTLNAFCSPFVGKLFDKYGAKKFLPLGYLLAFISSLLFVFTISADTPIWQVILAHSIFFIGISMIIMPAQTNGLNQLPRKLYGDGAAVMSTLQQIAGGIGTALAITLLVNGQTLHMEKFPNATPGELMAEGTKHAYIFILGLSIIGLILSLFVKREHVEKGK
ncbi:DHA2 family efflux MFS transporter permease subunit [Rummeliibacillus stabekisii]|uniref:MDR family MFS transporter n=1 Tax=Rummeliibacillus stabekisii TaxID=241244 RepID=UPI00203B0552|nr:MDR family MFS transporter [Rummeliibacillus stabekisii]MCM3317464.1 DHA2 family efflux MFS transporter permease subunit [Rummeliibacillus stabekisii]